MTPEQLRADRMFLVLAHHYHGEDLPFLTSFLNSEEMEQLKQEPPVLCDDVDILCAHPSEFLESVHYSWLKPVLEQLPPQLFAPTFASLSEKKQKRLEKIMNISSPPSSPVSPFTKKFLLRRLWKKLQPPHLLPKALIPESSMHPFLHKDKKELIDLIDLLGLYDIAEEILQIVDKKSLQNLYNCLSPTKRAFLKQCLQQKDRVSISKIGLEHWNGDKTKLDRALHRRGLFRFGKAFHGEHTDLIWYIAHTLDAGRGSILQRFSKEKGRDRVMKILKKQSLFAADFLRRTKK